MKSNNNASARLYPENPEVRALLPEGMIGLELETQRIDREGHLAQTSHPFEKEPFIDRDFGEAQIEINTAPVSGAEEAEAFLHEQLVTAEKKLMKQDELLWPFSCPPAIRDDSDIRIAEYTGDLKKKTVYRQYLAEKYGKRIMTLCGIHFNYSFSEKLLKKNYYISAEDERKKAPDAGIGGEDGFRIWKDSLYLQLAEKVLAYSWVVTALLSASPLADSSYSSGETEGQTVFTGYASLRCSREGYWNPFDPILCYEDISSYMNSIRQYRDGGLLRHEGELYYPVRIKPAGKYSLRNLCEGGVDHIELRMIDLNPLTLNGIDLRDLRFLQLFLIWLASGEREPLDADAQKKALLNQKNSARYDWNEIAILMTDGREVPMQHALDEVLTDMTRLFAGMEDKWQEALRHQIRKIQDPEMRYAQQVRDQYEEAFLSLGLERAKQLQKELSGKEQQVWQK